MKLNIGTLRPVTAALLAGLMVLGVAQPAAAASRRADQWYLDSLRMDQVHRESTGRGVVVAVLDSGVDARHPDLAGQVLPGFRSDGASGDGRADEDGHGTHMAGIIAATKDGPDGVLGIAPGAKILPVKIHKGSAPHTTTASSLGIRMAADRGAKVINLSFGGSGISQEESDAVRYALSKDAVVVAAAGNTARGGRAVTSPANVPGVIAVTGLSRRGSFWSGSVQGPEAVVAAPGERILNADIPLDGQVPYSWGNGTSDSAAIVSGVAALIRAKYPELDAANVINRIIKTSRDAGAPGRDPQYGFGALDPMAALTEGVPTVTTNPLLGAVDPGTSAEAAGDEDFDVTQYGDRGGPTDQQVMIIGIGIAVLLTLLLVVAIWLLVRWRRRRRAAPAGPHPPGMPPGHGPPPGAGGFAAGHRPPAPAVPPGYGPSQPGGHPPQGASSGSPGHGPPPGGPSS